MCIELRSPKLLQVHIKWQVFFKCICKSLNNVRVYFVVIMICHLLLQMYFKYYYFNNIILSIQHNSRELIVRFYYKITFLSTKWTTVLAYEEAKTEVVFSTASARVMFQCSHIYQDEQIYKFIYLGS